MKKIISILLSVVLILSSTFMASASYTKEVAAEELEKYGIPTKLCGTFDVSISKADLPWLQDCRC